MFDFKGNEFTIPAARLKEIKLGLEKEHGRDFTPKEVSDVAELMYKLARLALDQVMDEAEWKQKLEGNPKGYAFEPKGYSCRLCNLGGSDVGMWYDKYGLKCMHCQKAVESGLIPGELTGDHESFYTDYDLKSFFNVQGKALTQWINKKIIKPRIISRFGDPSAKHLRIFLIADNYGFLPQKEMLRFWDTVEQEVDGQVYERHLKWYQCCDPFEYFKDYKIMNYLRRTDSESPPTEQDAQPKKPKQEFCSQSAFPESFVNKRYLTKRRAKRKKQQ